MKKIAYILILCSLATATLFAQSGKDCVTSASICGSAVVPAPTSGIGSVTDAVPNSCDISSSTVAGTSQTESAAGWNNTTWVTFLITTAGTLQMNFDASPNADIDFALWRAPSGTSLTTACGALASYTSAAGTNNRCDYSASSTSSGFGSTTCGSTTQANGCDTRGAMTVAVGERIIAVVSDFSTFDNFAFTPVVGGTSARACTTICNSTASATCTASSIYANEAAADAGIDGCNVDEVRPGLVAGTQVQQFCNTFTTPVSLTKNTIAMAGTTYFLPGTASISYTSESLYTNAGVVIPPAFTSGGLDYWTIAPSTTYKYCWTVTGNGSVTQIQSPCFRPFYAACNISAVTVANKSACTDSGANDYYTADVTVTYTGVPGTGTLGLSGSQIHTAVTAVAVASVGATSYTFTGVKIKANGTASTITAAFSADAGCTANSASQAAVASCASCTASPTLGLGVTTP